MAATTELKPSLGNLTETQQLSEEDSAILETADSLDEQSGEPDPDLDSPDETSTDDNDEVVDVEEVTALEENSESANSLEEADFAQSNSEFLDVNLEHGSEPESEQFTPSDLLPDTTELEFADGAMETSSEEVTEQSEQPSLEAVGGDEAAAIGDVVEAGFSTLVTSSDGITLESTVPITQKGTAANIVPGDDVNSMQIEIALTTLKDNSKTDYETAAADKRLYAALTRILYSTEIDQLKIAMENLMEHISTELGEDGIFSPQKAFRSDSFLVSEGHLTKAELKEYAQLKRILIDLAPKATRRHVIDSIRWDSVYEQFVPATRDHYFAKLRQIFNLA